MDSKRRKPDTACPQINWSEDGASHSALWRSEAGLAPPARVQVVDDTLTADAAYQLACGGTALLWRGDFQNARQMLQAMARRIESKACRPHKAQSPNEAPRPPAEAFHLQRMAQAQRARTLGMLLIPCLAQHVIALRRAPAVQAACNEAYGPADAPYVTSLRELLGLIGAHEWRKKGVEIAALEARIHPHYGVFSPVRGEYVALVADAPLPPGLGANSLAFDVGTGTGVLAAVLARRGVARVVATDQDARALACAQQNIDRLGLKRQIDVRAADLFPPGRAPLVVCNPPWLPGRPSSTLDAAIYDLDSRMLYGFIAGLAAHLEADGEGWLILSDLAEHLGLRRREELLERIAAAGLVVRGRLDTRPTHPRAFDHSDALHAARAAEVTSLWRLTAAPAAG